MKKIDEKNQIKRLINLFREEDTKIKIIICLVLPGVLLTTLFEIFSAFMDGIANVIEEMNFKFTNLLKKVFKIDDK